MEDSEKVIWVAGPVCCPSCDPKEVKFFDRPGQGRPARNGALEASPLSHWCAKSTGKHRRNPGAEKRSRPGFKSSLSQVLCVKQTSDRPIARALKATSFPGNQTFDSPGSTTSTQESAEVILHQWFAEGHRDLKRKKEEEEKEGRKRIWQNHHTAEHGSAAPGPPALCNWYHKRLHLCD